MKLRVKDKDNNSKRELGVLQKYLGGGFSPLNGIDDVDKSIKSGDDEIVTYIDR